jgi:hypothetical protein
LKCYQVHLYEYITDEDHLRLFKDELMYAAHVTFAQRILHGVKFKFYEIGQCTVVTSDAKNTYRHVQHVDCS